MQEEIKINPEWFKNNSQRKQEPPSDYSHMKSPNSNSYDSSYEWFLINFIQISGLISLTLANSKKDYFGYISDGNLKSFLFLLFIGLLLRSLYTFRVKKYFKYERGTELDFIGLMFVFVFADLVFMYLWISKILSFLGNLFKDDSGKLVISGSNRVIGLGLKVSFFEKILYSINFVLWSLLFFHDFRERDFFPFVTLTLIIPFAIVLVNNFKDNRYYVKWIIISWSSYMVTLWIYKRDLSLMFKEDITYVILLAIPIAYYFIRKDLLEMNQLNRNKNSTP